MKYNYLQQIESSANFLTTEIFRIYYSRIPKEVDMNATSIHGSQFYLDNQRDIDNQSETQEPTFTKPLHLVEPHNENRTNLSAENLNQEPVDTMLTSRQEHNLYSIDNPEYDPVVGESVNLSHSQATNNSEIAYNTVSSASKLDHDQPVSESDSLVRPGEMKVLEEETASIVTSSLAPIGLKDDKKEDNMPTSLEQVRIDNDKIEVEYDSVNIMEIDDNPIRVKFDSVVVEPVPEEPVDRDKSTEIEDDQTKVDSLARIEEQRQLEKEALYENTFSLFHKLATPEKDLTLTAEETASAATVAKEPEVESLEETATMKAGAYLSSEREKSKLSVQQVADKLYLDVNLIKALEADHYEQLPPPIFIR